MIYSKIFTNKGVIMRKLLLGCVLSLVAVSANAEVLWQKAETGMTPNKVKSLFPNAIENDSTGYVPNNGKSLLKIPNYKVGMIDYKVDFIFNDDKLSMVRLQNFGSTANSAFEMTRELLKQKYGQPFDGTIKPTFKNIVWKNKGVLIRLQNSASVGNIPSSTVVLYQTSQLDESNKL